MSIYPLPVLSEKVFVRFFILLIDICRTLKYKFGKQIILMYI